MICARENLGKPARRASKGHPLLARRAEGGRAMLQLLKSTPTTLCDRISRRDWLRIGGLGILGLNLPNLLRAEDTQRRPRTRPAASCPLPVSSSSPLA